MSVDEYGCKDESLSPFLKCVVKQGNVAVTGVLPDGYSSSLQQNWESPFQSDGGGSLDKLFASGQLATGKTAKGYLAFLQTWAGSEPETFSIPLTFRALKNPEREVDLAVAYLKAMSAPRFDHSFRKFYDNPSLASAWESVQGKMESFFKEGPGNRVPPSVTVSLCGKLILPNVKIVSVDVDDPVLKTDKGFSTRQSVTLNITTASVVDAVDILARGVEL